MSSSGNPLYALMQKNVPLIIFPRISQNIHGHQVAFMKDFERQQGIAFDFVLFSQGRNVLYAFSTDGGLGTGQK